jgi:hypothetical protein
MVTELVISRSAAFARGGAVPFAMLFDLVVVLPLLYAGLVLRPAQRSLLEAAPVLALGALVAGVLLAARPEARMLLRATGAVTEVAVGALLIRRLGAASAQLKSTAVGAAREDLLLRLHALTDPLLRVAGAELALLYYVFAGPRRPTPSGPQVFSYIESSGLAGLLLALGLGASVEGLGVHWIVHPSSPRLAWALVALDAYTLMWLFAAYQAARLRPVVLEGERLLVRTSLVWTVDVPLCRIAAVTAVGASSGAANGKTPRGRVLRAALGAPPELLLVLKAPVVARGPFGVQRTVDVIALHVDEPARLLEALRRNAKADVLVS